MNGSQGPEPAGADRTGPLVDGAYAEAFTAPTDAPEADATVAWDATPLILVRVRAGATTGMDYTYGAPATVAVAVAVINEQFADVITGRCGWDVPAANEAMSRAVRNTGRPGLVAAPFRPLTSPCGTSRRGCLACPWCAYSGPVIRRSRCTAAVASPRTTNAAKTSSCAPGARSRASPASRSRSGSRGARPRPGTWTGWRGRGAASGMRPSCTWTPTAAMTANRPSGLAPRWRRRG